VVSETDTRLDVIQLDLGIVGPSSLADKTQMFVHSLSGAALPKGWDQQLRDEPGIVLTYQRKWRGLYEFSPFGMGADITPYAGGSVGNVSTQAVIGGTLRIGFDLPADYGPPRVHPA
jgi:lipid A 3-O-deacylase